MNKAIIVIIIFLTGTLSEVVAQGKGSNKEWTSISKEAMSKELATIQATYKTNSSYYMSITHASYKTYTGTTPYETMKGYFQKSKTGYASYLIGVRTIQNSDYKLIIDSTHRLITVVNPDKTMDNAMGLNDYTDRLKLCETIQKKETATETSYRFEFLNSTSIASYELVADANHYLKQMILYYATAITDEATGKDTKPRLVITFGTPKTTDKVLLADDVNHYIMTKNKQLVPTAIYKSYTLRDKRIPL